MASYSLRASRPYVLHIPDDDHIGKWIGRKNTAYERPALAAIESMVTPGGVIIDIGANVGNHTVYWAVNGFHVHAFEPNPAALFWLRRNIAENELNDRVEVHEVALGPTSGKASLETHNQNLGRSEARLDDDGSIEMASLDSLTFDRVDAIKIDVEGYELEVLAGASNTLELHRPLVMVEAWSSQVLHEMDRLLGTSGYRRFPAPIAGAPSYVYCPDLIGCARATVSPAVVRAVLQIALGRTKGRLLRFVRESQTQ